MQAQECDITTDSFSRLEKQYQGTKQVFKEHGESCPRAGKRHEPVGLAYGDLIGYVSETPRSCGLNMATLRP